MALVLWELVLIYGIVVEFKGKIMLHYSSESLIRAGGYLIFCVPGLNPGWGTQAESKISSFCFWSGSRE